MKGFYTYNDSLFSVHFSHSEAPKKEDFKLHTHEDYELFCFLEGKGNFKIEGTTYKLHSGDILVMNAGEAHYIDIDSSFPYTRLVINFRKEFLSKIGLDGELLIPFHNRKGGKFNLYRSANFDGLNYRIFLNNLCLPTTDRKTHTTVNSIALLYEVRKAFNQKKTENDDDSTMQKIITYINEHLYESFSLDEICNEFFISKAQLCRSFKSATGSTVWEYTTAKRLIAARSLIRSGRQATKIFSECGFKDYSSFFRAYKKRFGAAPTDPTIIETNI